MSCKWIFIIKSLKLVFVISIAQGKHWRFAECVEFTFMIVLNFYLNISFEIPLNNIWYIFISIYENNNWRVDHLNFFNVIDWKLLQNWSLCRYVYHTLITTIHIQKRSNNWIFHSRDNVIDALSIWTYFNIVN